MTTAPATIAATTVKVHAGSKVTDRAIAVARVSMLVGGIHDEWPPRAWTRKCGPQVTAQTPTAPTIAARQRHASRSRRRAGDGEQPGREEEHRDVGVQAGEHEHAEQRGVVPGGRGAAIDP